jgi:hypothetical protein
MQLFMADALAVLHWHTKVDAADIEFALESDRDDSFPIRGAIPLAEIKRLAPGASTYERVVLPCPYFSVGRKCRSVHLIQSIPRRIADTGNSN